MAMADRNGEVQASIPGLASVARVPVESVVVAINKFMSPDPFSRTKDDEGRRICEIKGGWLLLNHAEYRKLASDEDRKTKAAERQQRARDRKKVVTLPSRQISQAEAEAEAEAVKDSTLVASLPAAGALKEKTPKGYALGDTLAFQDFWASYPRKVAKSKALGLWVRLGCSSSLPEILKALESQKRSDQWTKDSGQFIPHPATWLFQKRWEDVMDSQGVAPAVGGRF